MTVWDDCRYLVANGEADPALDIVENFLKGRSQGPFRNRARPLLDTVLMVRARNTRLEANIRKGLLAPADAEAERARLDQNVLSLVSEIERIDNKARSLPTFPGLSEAVPTEKLMGLESQLRSTGWLAEGLRVASGVCRLTNGYVLGSGFRCREDAIVTNNHVIADLSSATGFHAEFFFEEDSARRLRVPLRVGLEPQRLFWTSKVFDITLIGHAPVAREDIAIVPLPPDTKVCIGDHVSIIQHPNGGPKQIAVTNNRILNVYGHLIHYLTDTLPGSSGSPVFTDAWTVAAIHRAGGNVRKNAEGDVIFANEGVLAASLYSDEQFRTVYTNTAKLS